MYKIIGADQQTYGPISSDQVLQWIRENRANAQTKVQAEGSDEWKPLSSFPEFAHAFANQSAPPPLAGFQPTGNRESALQAVKGPATALKVTAIIGLIVAILGLIWNVLMLAGINLGMDHDFGDQNMGKFLSKFGGGFGIFQGIINIVISGVLFQGASKMQRLENYQFAFTACILAMVPCVSPCCWFGLPFGIWALTVLNRPEVKSQFSKS